MTAKTLNVLPHQDDFIFSDAKHTGLVAGYGAGKSFAGTLKTLIKKLQNPQAKVAYYLPTYPMIRDIAFDKFPAMCEHLGLNYTLNKSNKELYIEGNGSVIFRNMAEPENIVGYEVGYSLIDECDILPKHKMDIAFQKIVARNRLPLPHGQINQIDVVGTPEGYKWFYDRFVTHADKFTRLIRASTLSNKHLPQEYIDVLTETYPASKLKAYLNGEFVNLTSGTVYDSFDRQHNATDATIKPHEILHIGMDFNVMNMSGIVHVVRDDIVYAVDEICGVKDTPTMAMLIQEKYEGHMIVIYPDATGRARKSVNASQSDITILKEAGLNVQANKMNPPVKDRINAFNRLLCNSNGDRRYLVNVVKCPTLTTALEQQFYDLTGEPDKSAGHDHVLDAAGYFVHKKFPIKIVRDIAQPTRWT